MDSEHDPNSPSFELAKYREAVARARTFSQETLHAEKESLLGTFHAGITHVWSLFRREAIEDAVTLLERTELQRLFHGLWGTMSQHIISSVTLNKGTMNFSWQAICGIADFGARCLSQWYDFLTVEDAQRLIRFLWEFEVQILGHEVPLVRESVSHLYVSTLQAIETIRRSLVTQTVSGVFVSVCYEHVSSRIRQMPRHVCANVSLLESYLTLWTMHIPIFLSYEKETFSPWAEVDNTVEILQTIHGHEASSIRQAISNIYATLGKYSSIEIVVYLIRKLLVWVSERDLAPRACETLLLAVESLLPRLVAHLSTTKRRQPQDPSIAVEPLPTTFVCNLAQQCVHPATVFELARVAQTILPLATQYAVLTWDPNALETMWKSLGDSPAFYRFLYEFMLSYVTLTTETSSCFTPRSSLSFFLDETFFMSVLRLPHLSDPATSAWHIMCALFALSHGFIPLTNATVAWIPFQDIHSNVPLSIIAPLMPDFALALVHSFCAKQESRAMVGDTPIGGETTRIEFLELCVAYLSAEPRSRSYPFEIFYVLPILEAISAALQLITPPPFLAYCPNDLLFTSPDLSNKAGTLVPNPSASAYVERHPVIASLIAPWYEYSAWTTRVHSVLQSFETIVQHPSQRERLLHLFDPLIRYIATPGMELPIVRYTLFIGAWVQTAQQYFDNKTNTDYGEGSWLHAINIRLQGLENDFNQRQRIQTGNSFDDSDDEREEIESNTWAGNATDTIDPVNTLCLSNPKALMNMLQCFREFCAQTRSVGE